jgi:hypothetical protein
VLEATGRLFGEGVRLYVYPMQERPGGPLITARDVEVPGELHHLYQYLLDNGLIRDMRHVDREQLHVAPDDVLDAIQHDRPGWEDSVPDTVARMIRERGYFGFG